MSYFAVIPSLGALGPLGLLALLAPAVFAAPMLWMRRWSAARGPAVAVTTVFLFQAWWQAPLRPSWWSTRAGMWATLAGIAGTFFVWALNRKRTSDSEGRWWRADRIVVAAIVAISGLSVAYLVAKSRG